MAPMVSTPAKPAPATTNVSIRLRTEASGSGLAISRIASMRARSSAASPRVFSVTAFSATPCNPKKLVSEPKASTR